MQQESSPFFAAGRPGFVSRRVPMRLPVGLALALIAWWLAWFGPVPVSAYTFFPLWLGYILTVDGITRVRTGSSLWERGRGRFVLLFLFSIPLWWVFEFTNRYLGNWRYLLPWPYAPLEWLLIASLCFSTVVPAIFVTAELVRTLPPFAPARTWRAIAPGAGGLLAISLGGALMVLLSLSFPRYAFAFVWIGFFLVLDPVNALLGNPSIAAQLRQGRWDTVLVLFAAGLICGWFWEMWNVLSMPKWVYEVPFVGRPKLFEMPILGYGGYLPFALEVFAAWSLLQGVLRIPNEGWLRCTQPFARLSRSTPDAVSRGPDRAAGAAMERAG